MAELRGWLNGSWSLRSLPLAVRTLLTLFLALIGTGYLMALGNLYCRFESADTRPGLSADDIRAHFHGLEVPTRRAETGGTPSADWAPKSRMLEMVEPGGKMHKNLAKGGDPAVRSLMDWLHGGARRDAFEQPAPANPTDPCPQMVITKQCLRCHNAEDGEKQDTPYGADLFTVDYDLVYKYAQPGTAKSLRAVSAPAVSDAAAPHLVTSSLRIEPQSLDQLFLVAHIHMLAMPIFSLIIGILFLMTGWPRGLKGALAVTPMAAMLVDFAAWWLARSIGLFTHVITIAGAVFGVALAIQLFAILYALWFGRRADVRRVD